MCHGWHTEIVKNRFHSFCSMDYIGHCCAKYLILNFDLIFWFWTGARLLKYWFSLVTGNHSYFWKVLFEFCRFYLYYLFIQWFLWSWLIFQRGFPSWPISHQRCILCRNQSLLLLCKTNDWFLYEMQHWADTEEGKNETVWNEYSISKSEFKSLTYFKSSSEIGKLSVLTLLRYQNPYNQTRDSTFFFSCRAEWDTFS